jgi:hypothetical protein
MQTSPDTLVATEPTQRASSLPKAGLIALALSVSINAALFLVGSALGTFPADALLPNQQPMTIVPVIVSSVFGVGMATLAFALLSRFVRNPVLAYRILAGVVLVLAAYPPFTIPNVSTAMVVVLNVMHVVVTGSTVWAFTRPGR